MLKRIFLMAAIVAVPATLLAQASAPPIKMGLWQTTSTSTMTGIQIPPEVAARLQAMGRPLPTAEPRTTVVQSCATPEKWKQMFQHLQHHGDCEFHNEHQTSSTLTADMACKSTDGRYSTNGHIDVSFVSEEKIHGKVHVETVMESQPQPIVTDMSFESVYQGADCHGVSPNEGKVIR